MTLELRPEGKVGVNFLAEKRAFLREGGTLEEIRWVGAPETKGQHSLVCENKGSRDRTPRFKPG